MRRFTWLAGLAGSGVLALLGAVDGCSSSSDHPPVLDGTNDSGRPSSSSSGGHSGSGSGSGSGGGSGRDSGSDSGGDSGGMMCLAGDGGCTDLQLCGPQVNVIDADASSMPAPQGGAIVPGTYVLTKVDYYGNGSGWLKQSIRLTALGGDGGAAEGGNDAAMAEAGGEGGAEMDASVIDAGSDAGPSLGFESISLTDSSPLTATSGTLSFPDPTTVNITLPCGGGTMPFIADYTATPTTLVFIVSPEVLTYTKQ